MIMNEKNTLVSEVCDKETMAYQFEGVLLDTDCTVATNGKSIAICTYPEQDKYEALENFVKHADITEKKLIPLDAVKKAVRNLDKKAIRKKPALGGIAINPDKDTVEFQTSNISMTDTVKTQCIEGQFPEYKNYINDLEEYKGADEQILTVGFSIEQLEHLVKIYKKFSDFPGVTMTLKAKVIQDKDGTVSGLVHDKGMMKYEHTSQDTGQTMSVYTTPVRMDKE